MNPDFTALSIGAVAVLVIIASLIKSRKVKSASPLTEKNSDLIAQSNFSKEQEVRNKKSLQEEKSQSAKAEGIRPQSNQQRNLDREVGGTEEGKVGLEKENKERVEASIKDVWDDRSEEVDRMGSFNPLASTAKKSMIWRLKRSKLSKKDQEKLEEAAEAYKEHQQAGKFNSATGQGGFRQMVQTRQDRSHEPGGRGGGAWR
ncbi:MAG: hypothetical protein A2887_06905 [Alphaproteobacteria bacterium RIFCSPLOWO2_01_FULL_40_26]|nr:MAG: hypothetical protein A3D15_02775 [Alphaproteobacteria bacterium RIFCSPHIGHO2_02_FULL_40_34]OFW87572.1 MAG: hypothetical protein A2794_00625 [Alphaproteobacteria bacterium RIFCSPHIGHO2_01_FULL_40_8]OFW95563.1 MAG: hypothetical protein A2887_06905 [Alphaproteobacteria bacterium RIFCSPLOWO2_01_FULL_40_26]OFX09615.1 MAG: hypothetical protein A3H30_01420 [Alphaproteobacteria bacterium RIFCSPLOWO2_02_FULL_40_19]OFX12299.1 MAG: hypothetical protein A3G22_06370 [Alphaproteobacteria bacterium RI